MTKWLQYDGRSHFREFGPEDLAKVGVDTDKTFSFAKGVPLEVNNDVAKAVLDNENLFLNFSEVDEPKPTDEAESAPEIKQLKRKNTPTGAAAEGDNITTPSGA